MVVPRTERLSFDFLVLGIQDVEISADALQIRPMYSVKVSQVSIQLDSTDCFLVLVVKVNADLCDWTELNWPV